MFRVDPRLIPLPRDLFIKALNAEGVPCSAGYSMPLYRQKVFVNKDFAPFAADARRRRDVNYAKCRLPNTERLCAEVVWLYQSVLLGSLADIRDIVRAVKKVRDHYRELV
jgi:dTDP-4-amino-4,6-dideoxygalactose transaminase